MIKCPIIMPSDGSQCSAIMQKDNTNIISTAGIEQIILPSKVYEKTNNWNNDLFNVSSYCTRIMQAR